MTEPEYVIGKAFDIAKLRAPKRTREPSPRDIALTKAVRAAAAAAPSQVIPFSYPASDKQATVKAAAKRIVAELDLQVNVGASAAYPNTLLLSRGTISNRGRRRPAT